MATDLRKRLERLESGGNYAQPHIVWHDCDADPAPLIAEALARRRGRQVLAVRWLPETDR